MLQWDLAKIYDRSPVRFMAFPWIMVDLERKRLVIICSLALMYLPPAELGRLGFKEIFSNMKGIYCKKNKSQTVGHFTISFRINNFSDSIFFQIKKSNILSGNLKLIIVLNVHSQLLRTDSNISVWMLIWSRDHSLW